MPSPPPRAAPGTAAQPVSLTPCGWDDWKRGRGSGRAAGPFAPTAGFLASERSRSWPTPHERRPAARSRVPRTGSQGSSARSRSRLSLVAIARTPALLAPVAILVGIVAARMSEAHQKLAGWTVGIATTAFLVGMTVAISTDNALF